MYPSRPQVRTPIGGCMSTADPIDAYFQDSEPAQMSSREWKRSRRTPVTWVRGGGLATLLFLLPMLLIFGAFSWYPIVRTVIMALQHTNLVTQPTWVGLHNFATVIHDPLFPIAVKN